VRLQGDSLPSPNLVSSLFYLKVKIMENEFLCYFCNEPASLIAFYQKYYFDKGTIENPIFSCEKCWLCPEMKAMLGYVRGGREGIACLTFQDISKMPKKKIGYYLSRKYFEINHFNNSFWRKVLYRIHYTNLPPKGALANGSRLPEAL
jgi:hypothetical protein